MSREIIDNALPTEVFNNIKNELFSSQFPWFFANNTIRANSTLQSVTNYKFHHIVCGHEFPTTFAANFLQPLFKKLNVVSILFCRIFMSTYTGQNINHGFHCDAYADKTGNPVYNHMNTAIYYINTNNGGTEFEDGQFVNSVENRILIFNSQDRHAAVTATDVPARIVVNINYF